MSDRRTWNPGPEPRGRVARMPAYVGIDLASDARRTGVVVAALEGGRLRAALPGEPFVADDEVLVELVGATTFVGLDAPLGWPDDFIDAFIAHRVFTTWPSHKEEVGIKGRERYRLRATDRFVRELDLGVTPLSVSSDLIGVVAMRAAVLQGAWASRWGAYQSRDGSGRLVEAYPAAALRRWGLRARDSARYKSGSAAARGAERAERQRMLGALESEGESWLERLAERVVDSDHVFDALISVLCAVAASRGATVAPPSSMASAAKREGWIHVPACDLVELGARLALRGVEGSA